jgi:hypothetical protein
MVYAAPPSETLLHDCPQFESICKKLRLSLLDPHGAIRSEIPSTHLSTTPETVLAEDQVQTELSNLRGCILQQSLLTESMQALIMSDSLPKEVR